MDISQPYPELTPELKQELDRRSREHDAHPDDVMTREEVWASIRRRDEAAIQSSTDRSHANKLRARNESPDRTQNRV